MLLARVGGRGCCLGGGRSRGLQGVIRRPLIERRLGGCRESQARLGRLLPLNIDQAVEDEPKRLLVVHAHALAAHMRRQEAIARLDPERRRKRGHLPKRTRALVADGLRGDGAVATHKLDRHVRGPQLSPEGLSSHVVQRLVEQDSMRPGDVVGDREEQRAHDACAPMTSSAVDVHFLRGAASGTCAAVN